jgi:hypothetical protein
MLRPMEQEAKMETPPSILVIDLFGKSYDGLMPSDVLICDQSWLGLFPVAPPSPPAVESNPEGRPPVVP